MKTYLESSDYIDWRHPTVSAKAAELAAGTSMAEDVDRRCFEFVRDRIRHSWDHRLNPVTSRASDVLQHGTGYCYAKSHLLAALLRANGIPAGLCYQRLSIGSGGPPYSLHGLNAVWLDGHGWYRVNARGNKPGVAAEFCPPVERLAYPLLDPYEVDLPETCSGTLFPYERVRLSTYVPASDLGSAIGVLVEAEDCADATAWAGCSPESASMRSVS